MAQYARAMDELDAVDAYCRDKLFNIGFCYLACWTNPKGLSWTRRWKQADLLTAIQRFSSIQSNLMVCLEGTSKLAGRRYLRFLDNRLGCTILHLHAIEQLLTLHSACDDAHPESLGAKERTLLQERCRSALRFADQYMRLHAEAIEDRGCEGTLISYYHTIPAYVNRIQNVFLKGETKASPPSPTSQPPAPGDSSRPSNP